jgi:hypothetical protein
MQASIELHTLPAATVRVYQGEGPLGTTYQRAFTAVYKFEGRWWRYDMRVVGFLISVLNRYFASRATTVFVAGLDNKPRYRAIVERKLAAQGVQYAEWYSYDEHGKPHPCRRKLRCLSSILPKP